MVFDDIVMGMTQQGHNLRAKTKSASPIVNPPAHLPPAQLAAAADSSIQHDFIWPGHHVARVDTRLTTMEELLSSLSQ